MGKPVVELQSVTKSYGGRDVLRDVSLTVASGSLVALTGRSGGGKSTLLRLVAGLDRPTRGRVLVEGVDVAALDDLAASRMRLRRIGIVFQSLNLLPDLTVAQNVRLPLDLAGAPRSRGDARAADLLRLVGMDGFARRRPASLSGGEAQRVAIARALANEPAIVLADEPTSSLDSAGARAVIDLLEEIHERRGATILLVTHDPVVTARFPRSLALDDGRLLAAPPGAP